MKAIVRDDIIGLECYVDAEFKYKEYIEVIAQCGGYCFMEQVERLWKNEGGRYLVQKMEDANLVKTHYFSNYKYLVLTSNALKYLYYRNDERDFSDIPKNKISIKNLKANPSEKVLFSSVMNFELCQTNKKNTFFMKNKHIDIIEKNFKIDNTLKIQKLESNNEKLLIEYKKYEFAENSQKAMYERISEKNRNLYIKMQELTKEITTLEENTSILNRNSKKIEKLNEEIEMIKEELLIYNTELSAMNKIINKRKEVAIEYNEKKEEIEKLQNEQVEGDNSIELIIKKLMNLRDVSKIIFIPFTKEDGTASAIIVSTFVKYHKSNYLEIMKDIFGFMYQQGFNIKSCELITISIFEPPQRIHIAIKKVEDNYKQHDSFDFVWRKVILEGLQSYFDNVSDSISYIKKDHVEQFEELRDKLLKK